MDNSPEQEVYVFKLFKEIGGVKFDSAGIISVITAGLCNLG